MKKAALKTYGKIVGILLSFVTFLTGCDWPFSPEPVAEYGVPSADYVIKGKVTSSATEKPIKNIRVVIPGIKYPFLGLDTTYTDANGEYEVKYGDFPILSEQYKVVFSDIDGANNDGQFRSDTLKVSFSASDQVKKGSGWYSGIFQKTNQNIALKKDEVGAMYGVMGANYKEDDK